MRLLLEGQYLEVENTWLVGVVVADGGLLVETVELGWC